MATDHLVRCVKILNEALQMTRESTPTLPQPMREGYHAVFELIELDWDFTGDKEELIWREGYEMCMTDIVYAIADEWGVDLPSDPERVAAAKKGEGDNGTG